MVYNCTNGLRIICVKIIYAWVSNDTVGWLFVTIALCCVVLTRKECFFFHAQTQL